MNKELVPKGRYQVRIMEILMTNKVIRNSMLRKITNYKDSTITYARNGLIKMGLIEKHGDLICLPGYGNEISKNDINKPLKDEKKPKRTT